MLFDETNLIYMFAGKQERKHASLWLVVACLLSTAGYVLAFAPFNVFVCAFGFAVPLLLTGSVTQSRRRYAMACAGFGFFGWLFTLLWLRHVYAPYGWFGVLALAGILMWFTGGWCYLAGRALRSLQHGSFSQRMVLLLGLSGMWVVLEWVRSWLLSGFPWNPLSASQWLQPAMLSVAAYTGHYGVSFLLIFFNLALLSHLGTLLKRPSQTAVESRHLETLQPKTFGLLRGMRPELLVALLMVVASLVAYLVSFNRPREPLLEAAVIQPWIPAKITAWTTEERQAQLQSLGHLTYQAVFANPDDRPDLVVWHETAAPFAYVSRVNTGLMYWMQTLIADTGVPILHGGTVVHYGAEEVINALFLTTLDGPHQRFYSKRRLVPFGEYIPLQPILGWIGKVVPGSFTTIPGQQPELLPLKVGERTVRLHPLICYEDIFPKLAREGVKEADLIVVVTNDAWYGTEGGAYQHASHSVLRAVETRRPVIRCGNNGWSGWIDEQGRIRSVLTDENGSIYTKGWKRLSIDQDVAYRGSASVYVRFGDWFVLLSAAMMWLAWRERPIEA